MSFTEKWASDVWPSAQEKYRRVLAQRPAKQDTATGTHYGEQVDQALAEKKEVRNFSCNLAFTDPTANTVLQKDISFATVERFALDMFVDTVSVTPDDDQVAASAATDASQVAEDGSGGRRAEKKLLSTAKKWRIPARVPRGYEIPIAIASRDAEPEKGRFRRLGVDVVVNATWLAMKWALDAGDGDAERALEKLMLDWPFDFHLFEGD